MYVAYPYPARITWCMIVWMERQDSSAVSRSRIASYSASLNPLTSADSSATARSYSSIMAPTPPFRYVRVFVLIADLLFLRPVEFIQQHVDVPNTFEAEPLEDGP